MRAAHKYEGGGENPERPARELGLGDSGIDRPALVVFRTVWAVAVVYVLSKILVGVIVHG